MLCIHLLLLSILVPQAHGVEKLIAVSTLAGGTGATGGDADGVGTSALLNR